MKELITLCKQNKLTIAELMMANEAAVHTEKKTKLRLLEIFHTMQQCIKKGCNTEGILPGGLNVRRRANDLLLLLENLQLAPFENGWQHLESLGVSR